MSHVCADPTNGANVQSEEYYEHQTYVPQLQPFTPSLESSPLPVNAVVDQLPNGSFNSQRQSPTPNQLERSPSIWNNGTPSTSRKSLFPSSTVRISDSPRLVTTPLLFSAYSPGPTTRTATPSNQPTNPLAQSSTFHTTPDWTSGQIESEPLANDMRSSTSTVESLSTMQEAHSTRHAVRTQDSVTIPPAHTATSSPSQTQPIGNNASIETIRPATPVTPTSHATTSASNQTPPVENSTTTGSTRPAPPVAPTQNTQPTEQTRPASAATSAPSQTQSTRYSTPTGGTRPATPVAPAQNRHFDMRDPAGAQRWAGMFGAFNQVTSTVMQAMLGYLQTILQTLLTAVNYAVQNSQKR